MHMELSRILENNLTEEKRGVNLRTLGSLPDISVCANTLIFMAYGAQRWTSSCCKFCAALTFFCQFLHIV